MSSSLKEEKLFILLVSDIHESKELTQKLVSLCKSKNYKPDYIFCLGDIVTIPDGHQDDESIHEQKEKEIKEILTILETLSPNLIYLPGNHDPYTYFKERLPRNLLITP